MVASCQRTSAGYVRLRMRAHVRMSGARNERENRAEDKDMVRLSLASESH